MILKGKSGEIKVDDQKLATVLTAVFQTEKASVVEMEDALQEDWDYKLYISADGTEAEEKECNDLSSGGCHYGNPEF